MALSQTLTQPFRLVGLSLPPQAVLLCRLLALALLLTWHPRQIQTPFVPFLPFFDDLPGVPFQRLLQAALVLGSLAILFTRHLRVAALVTGSALLLAVLSSRAYYGNNKLFTALLLILAACGDVRLLRWQVVILYLGAGLNKLLDPDWQSGLFFDYWAKVRLHQPLYLWAAPLLPPLALGKLFCWTTIAVELALPLLFSLPRLFWPGVWLAALFQCGLLLFTGDVFNLFFFASQISLLAFIEWPQQPITVLWDGECGFCAQSKSKMEAIDWDSVLDWVPQQTNLGERWGLSRATLANAMYSVSGGTIRKGYAAWRAMVVWLPLFWYVALAAVVLAPRPAVIGLLLFLTPLSNPIGEAAYAWVARNRHRFGDQTCALPPR
jgi:predicted DCC family thiol-disulfide oxidoreductase YuxK